ncbi:cytochrome o ubiquinol oxidase subunit III [Buchnera aphidicola (Macrosiphoniella sanborni)]|uniref:Cytochrome bo(3) ubiquinol oxidase subunit 3 n=1 Tax=Buchnera aphidicola (Macrosiphoniella sanborni) TaxID=1241865 RepID=A0A4D6Y4F7_9GAMM|nr:cytochrome o ubiquinol oxidase subunit III [Buchnera aphidicola]QCI23979.1 cytochrome o ubiquinol oxidase subunit III [Buchnera aphidicola (Macrosiphoniella sanborni)]
MIKYENNNITSKVNFNGTLKKQLDNNKLFGLWIYLMSDCIIFAVLFAVYAIFSSNVTINLISNEIFNLSSVLLETFLLLLSSLSSGLIVIAMNKKKYQMLYCYLTITFILGFMFLCMEIYEFYELIKNNFSPDKHALFSIFFTLVGTHGVHIFFGLVLILSILYQLKNLGLTNTIYNRILCLSIFWHFLDIIWVCIFTFVYLNGSI